MSDIQEKVSENPVAPAVAQAANEAAKSTEHVEIPEDKASVMQKGNLIVVAIPLDKTPRAMARGLLLEVDDMLRINYARMEQEKQSKIIKPQSTGIKGKLARIFK